MMPEGGAEPRGFFGRGNMAEVVDTAGLDQSDRKLRGTEPPVSNVTQSDVGQQRFPKNWSESELLDFSIFIPTEEPKNRV